jgi:L-fuconolactonase
MEAMGPERLMFGSDWPVANLAGGYRKIWAELSAVFASMSESERSAVLGGTAARFYSIS